MLNINGRAIVIMGLLATLVACGSDTDKSSENSENNAVRLPVDELCESTAQTSSCEGDCTIVADYVVSCDDSTFTDPGLQTLISEGGATVVISSDAYGYAFDISAGELKMDNSLPRAFWRNALLSQFTSDGRLAVVGYASRGVADPESVPDGLFLGLRDSEGWQVEEVPGGVPVAFDWDLMSDTARVWMFGEDDGYDVASRSASGDWTSATQEGVTDFDGTLRFVSAGDGVDYVFDYLTIDDDIFQLHVREGDEQTPVGVVYEWTAYGYRVVARPERIQSEIPFFVLQATDTALTLSTLGGESIELPGTSKMPNWDSICTAGDLLGEESCNTEPDCVADTNGIIREEFDVAWLNAQEVIVGYVWSEINATYSYSYNFIEDRGSECDVGGGVNSTSATFRVVKVNIETGDVAPLFEVPTGLGASDKLFYDITPVYGVDIATNGTDLAAALNFIREDDEFEHDLRVIYATLP